MEMKEEKQFVLHMMKFIFQVYRSRLPENLKNLLNQFPIDEYSNFSVTITKAVLILINNIINTKEFPPDIGSRDFNSAVMDIRRSYTPLEFLKFCSSYGLKAAVENNENKSESPTILYETIMQIFETTKERGLFTEESWDDLDKISSKIVADDEEMWRGKLKNEHEMWAEMSLAKEFVLRTMNHIFALYFKDMPGYLGILVDELEDHENNPLTPTISHALTCLMDSQMEVILNIGVEGIEKYFYESVLKSFNERDFLELCVCYSRKAVLDFYEEDKFRHHLHLYDTLMEVLDRAKEKNKFISWEKMEEVATLIIEEDRERTESELEYLFPPSRSKSGKVELEVYTPLMRVNTAENLEYTPMVRRNEAENLGYTPLMRENEAENSECTLKKVKETENLECSPEMRVNEAENLEYTPLMRVNEEENLLRNEQTHKRSCSCCKCS